MQKTKKHERISRILMLDNAVYFHGHLFLYFTILFFFLAIIFFNVYLLIPMIISIIPTLIYFIDILIGRYKKVTGMVESSKVIIPFSIFKINKDDNECKKMVIRQKDGTKQKVICYKSTIDKTKKAKAKITKHHTNYECTYYYLPITKVVIDIDYKTIY